ncbi:unnamed protein product [Trifolium pratense]|uniref:Uncharacterized protein n=1 Tax=Trifolium pratense TaxID=57577 RepID=A0ACB0J4K0_TRIPR|nr:unnamed protein product [Trifolium pratense]
MTPGTVQNDSAAVSSSQSLTDETTAKQQQMTTTAETLTSPPSSGDDSHHDIPFDLVQEILCRLPVKSLMQFQCVCKSWKLLISGDHKFAKKHLHISITQSRHHLMVNKWKDALISSIFDAVSEAKITQTKLRSPPFLNKGYYFVSVASCHGIVCFQIPYYVVFWNPSIGKYKTSPFLRLAQHYGLGYDHVNDNYKLVAVYNYDDQGDSSDDDNGNGNGGDDDDDDDVFEVSKKTEVMVHTLGTDCWRKIRKFPCGVPVGKSAGIFIGGAINWVTSKDGNEFYASSYFIVSLNMANESYQEILQPDYGELFVVGLTLGVLRDCLCIFSHGESFVDIWLMNEYGVKKSWNKLFTIPFVKDIGLYPSNKAIYIYEDEQVLLVSSDDEHRSNPKLVVYDSKSDTFKFPEIAIRKVPTIYVESLITTCF